jgi:Restriction endonuclease
MPSIITSSTTERTLRSLLRREGYRLSKTRLNGETGVDVLATRAGNNIHIEVIGFKSSAPARSRDFMQSFFRAVSRIQDGASRCVIALPQRWKTGLPQRAKHYGTAWQRMGRAFPELEIWLVDSARRTYSTSRWNDWLAER